MLARVEQHGNGVQPFGHWTRTTILSAIHRLQEDGLALTYENAERAYPGIYEGARTVCGSWNAALEAAGCSRR